jgi:transposase-like protein
MKKRLVDLRSAEPILDIVSYGRGGGRLTPSQREQIARTVGYIPEVVVRVSGGARTLAGVEQHMDYVGREGELGMETDEGIQVRGKHFQQSLVRDWDLDLEAYAHQTERSIRGRKPPKLVHNVFFSMPPGTPAKAVLRAVRKFANEEFALTHRYAMVLHTDQPHPHVHLVVKAVSETGERLNIRKATLRSWRRQFAENLRELGVAANATERAVRGQPRGSKLTPIFRANQRGESTYMHLMERRATSDSVQADAGNATLMRTRQAVLSGWGVTADRLEREGDFDLARKARRFADQMPPVQTDLGLLAASLNSRMRPRDVPPPQRTR